MNYLMTSSTLVLFALFYELSGGANFTPASKLTSTGQVVEDAQVAGLYVPFDQPIITAPAPVEITETRRGNLPEGFEIVQAAVVENAASQAVQPRRDIRIVAGDRVNMRTGPARSFDVITTLPRGVEAEILQVNDSDWAEIRLLETGETGWMAAWLLSD